MPYLVFPKAEKIVQVLVRRRRFFLGGVVSLQAIFFHPIAPQVILFWRVLIFIEAFLGTISS